MGIRVRHANGCHILDPELVSFRILRVLEAGSRAVSGH
jgi:hypothetical protein